MTRQYVAAGLVGFFLAVITLQPAQAFFSSDGGREINASETGNNGVAVGAVWHVPLAPALPEVSESAAPEPEKKETYHRRWQDFLGCAWVDYDAGNVGPCDTRDPEAPTNETDPLTVLYSALEVARIEGAGLRIQPWIQTFVGVPTLAYATAPHVNTSVSVLGLDVPIEFTARKYSFDFGDGSDPLVSSEPGAPYPDMTNFHIYQRPQEYAQVSLTTTWSAKVTHPVTGDVIFVTGALQTKESAPPIPVRKARGYLTDTAEELMGR